MTRSINRRVLAVDDEESIRESFRAAFSPRQRFDGALASAAAALFEEESPPSANAPVVEFELDTAPDGKSALALVEQALAEDRPYAVIFCDMRMPGWDGVETVDHIRRLDARVEIVFVTAFSDRSVDEIVASLGANVAYFLKPFAIDEMKQLATKAVLDWNKARDLESLLDTVSRLSGTDDDLTTLLRYVLSQLCEWMGAHSGGILALPSRGRAKIKLGIGEFANLAEVPLPELDAATLADGSVQPVGPERLLLPINDVGLALIVGGTTRMTPERSYLLKLFLEHAALAIRNREDRTRLAQAERMAAVGQALGFVVHDLRGSIGSVQMLADILEMGHESFDFTLERITVLLQRSAEQSLDLIRDTIEFSRGEVALRLTTVDLSTMLHETCTMLRLSWPEGVGLEVEVPKDLCSELDEGRIRRAIYNLAKNAAEAVQGKGRVQIKAKRVDDRLQLEVSDDGPGLPPDIQERLFSPFATHGKIGGTGFGLAIVKQVVDAHGGIVEVITGAAGTTFRLILPTTPVGTPDADGPPAP